jgi:hypothetical protein
MAVSPPGRATSCRGCPFWRCRWSRRLLRWRWLTIALALVSIAQQTLLTATDAQNPLAVGGHARIDDAHRKDDFFCQIVGEYAWPLFAYGRAWPVLNKLIAVRLENEDAKLTEDGVAEPERKVRLAALEKDLRDSIARGDSDPLVLGAIRGPVSVNPIGAYDGLLTFSFFPAGSVETDWNSFNVGEFFFPQSRASLLPLLFVTGRAVCRAHLPCRARRQAAGVDSVMCRTVVGLPPWGNAVRGMLKQTPCCRVFCLAAGPFILSFSPHARSLPTLRSPLVAAIERLPLVRFYRRQCGVVF